MSTLTPNWQSPVTRLRYGGLRGKIMTTIVVGMGLIVAVTVTMSATGLNGAMIKEYDSKGEAITIGLAQGLEFFLVEDRDISTQQGFMDRFQVIEGVGYLYFLDPTGDVSLHTFKMEFPDALKSSHHFPGHVTEEKRVDVQEVTVPGMGRYRDVVTLLQQGSLGELHVGMKMSVIESLVASTVAKVAGVGLAIFLMVALLGLVISTRIVQPVRQLTAVAQRIVDEGDLSQQPQVTSSDEIGVLAESFGKMVVKLREIPMSLQDAAQLLQDSVKQLMATATEQSQMASRQAAALQEAHVTAQEIKQTSALAAQKAEAVLKVTDRASDVGTQGESAIELSLAELGEIRARVEQIANKITQLSDRTVQIGNITQTVKDLADQSNMLALNAAIEAVRSGEHGKGFAVVAREIRSLADQSIQATTRVRENLEDISAAIRAAVQITDQGKQRMESGLVQMKSSGENLRELSSIVKDNASAVRQIAAAVNQQNAGVSQIFTSVTELSKMMEETMSRLESTTRAVSTVREVTERVSAIVKTYRV